MYLNFVNSLYEITISLRQQVINGRKDWETVLKWLFLGNIITLFFSFKFKAVDVYKHIKK